MTDRDPVRLRDAGSDADDELRRALAEAKDVPSDRLARVAERLGSGGPGPGSGSGPASSGLRTIGIVGAAVVAVGVGLVAWQMLGTTHDVVTAPSHVADAPSLHVARPEPVPEVVPTPAPTPPVVAPEPQPVRHPAAEAESEAQLLLRARRALPTGAPRALALVREHARRFPDGDLVEEREALRVEALVASGRADEARRAFAQFRAQFAGSAHLEHLSQLISSRGP